MAKRITDEDLRLNLIINGDGGKKEMLELERQMKDFSYREFEASPTAEREGICNVITSFAVRDAVKELTERVLQPLRDKVGHPLRINSGYRCPELNRMVGGVPTSQHVKGEAADIAAADPFQLAKVVRNTPEIWKEVDQMIIYPTFVHISHRKGGPQRRQLLYNKRYQGGKVLIFNEYESSNRSFALRLAVAAEPAGAAAVLVVRLWVQIIQGELCNVLDNVFREDARWDQPRTLHRAPLPLSSLIIEQRRSEDHPSRIWPHTAVLAPWMALPDCHRPFVAAVGVGTLHVQRAAGGQLLRLLHRTLGRRVGRREAMKPGWILLLVAALVATVSVLSWRLGYRAAVASTSSATVADTLIVRDTVTVKCPVPVFTTIIDTILVAYPDIVIIHDTTLVQLPRERKEYSGKDYRAVVSGFQPSLDLIQVFPETKTITQTISVAPQKRSHWSIALQAGYGLTLQNSHITPLPYIGAGISYSLVEW